MVHNNTLLDRIDKGIVISYSADTSHVMKPCRKLNSLLSGGILEKGVRLDQKLDREGGFPPAIANSLREGIIIPCCNSPLLLETAYWL
jgi:hypothetical protein